jgi:streptomycin 6-kinase
MSADPNSLSLPDDFRSKVISRWKEKGQHWLDNLPDVVDRCATQWQLTVGRPVDGLSFNYVAAATTADGREVILKVGNPEDDLSGEVRALRAFRDKRVAKLLQSDGALRALLLEKIYPGTSLASVQSKDDEEATRIVAELIRDLPTTVPAEGSFGTYVAWTDALRRVPKDFPELAMVTKAAKLVRELEETKTQEKLLHGDLHHHNIMLGEMDRWVAIDPKGVVGDPAAEAGRMLHNPRAGFLATDHPEQRAERRIEILADVTGLSGERLKKWGFVDAVLSAVWNVNPEYRIECAKVFETIGA